MGTNKIERISIDFSNVYFIIIHEQIKPHMMSKNETTLLFRLIFTHLYVIEEANFQVSDSYCNKTSRKDHYSPSHYISSQMRKSFLRRINAKELLHVGTSTNAIRIEFGTSIESDNSLFNEYQPRLSSRSFRNHLD